MSLSQLTDPGTTAASMGPGTASAAPAAQPLKWLRGQRAKVIAGQIAFASAFLALWQFGAGRLFDVFFFSTPLAVLNQIGRELVDPGFYSDLGVTALEVASAFVFGATAGIALGVLLARWTYLAAVLDPFLSALNSIPRIAVAPMLIVWFGIDMASKIFLGATLVFFIMFFNTLGGIRSVDKALCNVARVQGATDWQIFTKVMLPSASSWIITGLKMSMPFALVGVILGEFLVSAHGLGYRLNAYSTSYNTAGALAIIVLMMLIMMMLTGLMNKIEARVLRWRPRNADERVIPQA